MSQMSFSDFGYTVKREQTRRKRYLAEMEPVVPWPGLMKEARYEITLVRQFARLTLSAPIPKDTTIMNFWPEGKGDRLVEIEHV